MTTKPFRWTKKNKRIRNALQAGITKDHILRMLDTDGMRPSEAAMTVSSWSRDIDNVAARMPEVSP